MIPNEQFYFQLLKIRNFKNLNIFTKIQSLNWGWGWG